jgi:hypothetical protein
MLSSTVLNPRVHLQEDSCTYGYICLYAYMLIPLHVNILYLSCMYSHLLEDEPSGSNHVEDIVKIKLLV